MAVDVRVVEAKLVLNAGQKARLRSWMKAQQAVWNNAVQIVHEALDWCPWDKESKSAVPATPCATFNPRWGRDARLNFGWLPSCPIKWKLDDGHELRDFGKKSRWVHPTRLRQHGRVLYRPENDFEMISLFSDPSRPRNFFLDDCVAKITHCTAQRASRALTEFLKGNRKAPRHYKGPWHPVQFKGKRNPLKTLLDNNSKRTCRVDGNKVKIPTIGWLKTVGLKGRWPEGTLVSTYKILERSTGWFVQLTGEFPVATPSPRGPSIGLDMGIHEFYTDDRGHHVDNPRYLAIAKKRLKRLQRRAARSFRANSFQVRDSNGKVMRTVVPPEWGQKNYRKLMDAVAREHDRIKRQRRAFHHYHSTMLVRKAGAIAVEDLSLDNMRAAVPRGEAGVPNGRKAKSGLNRALQDAAHGQFLTFLENKAKSAGVKFCRVDPAYTSQICPGCGHSEPKPNKKDRMVTCSACGLLYHRDASAAIEIRNRAQNQGWETKPKAKKASKAKTNKASKGAEVK